MANETEDKSDIEILKDDVAALKRDLGTLVEHLKGGAAGGATSQLGDEAKQLYARLAAEGARSAEALGKKVEEQPLTSLLISFVVGFVAGRVLAR